MERFVFDPYIVRAIEPVSAAQVRDSFAKLYPDLAGETEEERAEDLRLIEHWLGKLCKKPGLALSTGTTKSDRGMFTCSLLDVLGVLNPKARRVRMEMAWAVMDSPEGSKNIGEAPELDDQRRKRDERASNPSRPNSVVSDSVKSR